jgi:hypothetical protein
VQRRNKTPLGPDRGVAQINLSKYREKGVMLMKIAMNDAVLPLTAITKSN